MINNTDYSMLPSLVVAQTIQDQDFQLNNNVCKSYEKNELKSKITRTSITLFCLAIQQCKAV